MSNFKISRLLTEAMYWSSVVIFPKDERIEKGQELGREGKACGESGPVSQHQGNAMLSIEDFSFNFLEDMLIIFLALDTIFLCNYQ